MSTFEGIVEEIPGISIDRFDGSNTESTVLFLSHCHTDHMVGLGSAYVQGSIIKENKYIYLSPISATILRNTYPNLANNLKELALEQVNSIPVAEEYISVTCVPAGHCPGSVMFLLETKNSCILYTGDYRIAASDIRKFKCFYDAFGNVKHVDKIYLDTTFFMESYQTFPKRKDSLAVLCDIILSWTSQDPENRIILDLSAKYGYEYVFKEIFSKCLMPVYVNRDMYNFYSKIPELDQCVTTNKSITQIHNCCVGQNLFFCVSHKIRRIKLSALRWKSDDLKTAICEVDQIGKFFVCYSTHASYQEGVALIEFLKPKNIHVCVERLDDPEANLIMKKLVAKHLKKVQFEEDKPVFQPPELFPVQTFLLKPTPNKRKASADAPVDKELERILDSPPR